ncbi:hypothetical protein ACO229_06465 [Promicromonospora sp. MS192]|uniref:hypothetical protein n=1 Tax=Promicromonospora sp. MS192 TaxID=3412684 RepID=UPI003C2BD0F4
MTISTRHRDWCRKELGHVLLHDVDNVDAVVHRGIAEVEAESFALMIAASHGMNTEQYTVPYVAIWASRAPGQDPITTVQQTAVRVRAAALQTLDRLETATVPDGEPPTPTASTRTADHAGKAPRTPEPATQHAPARPGPVSVTEGPAL